MLRGMSAKQWLEWQVYMELAPFAEERADFRVAWIIQTLRNLAHGSKKRVDIFEVMNELRFGDREDVLPPAPTRKQTPQEQSQILRMMFNVEALEALKKQKKKG